MDVPNIGASPAFADLVERLLVKDPAKRLGWDELPGHPFWKVWSKVPEGACYGTCSSTGA